MNSVHALLIFAQHKVTTNDVVVIKNFGVVAIQNTLNERIIIIKYSNSGADVMTGLDSLPVVLKVQPVFSLHFIQDSVHAFCMTDF